jgi:hypothetical protein
VHTRWAVIATLSAALAVPGAASACCDKAHLMPEGKEPGEAPLAIGDSVMLGAAPDLLERGFEVDTKGGRIMHGALTILARRAARETLPDAIVIAIGTNIPIQPPELTRLIETIGRERRLVLVTPFRAWRPFATAPLWRTKRLHPKQVRIMDWATEAAAHPAWLYGDGTHLRPEGARAYARLVRAAARTSRE